MIFDLDGVITDTASVHAAAWKRLFDEFLEARARTTSEKIKPYEHADYLRHIDGKPRYDGVRDFLSSRGIHLDDGDPSDLPDLQTVCGLGNRKNQHFLAHIAEHGVRAYPSSVELVRALRRAGIGTGIISSSRNATAVLDAAGAREEFDVKIDGADAAALGLPGKPDPAVFLAAAERLGVAPSRAAVVEDAISGVEAGHRGRFALVIGVDRAGQAYQLRAAGADVVVDDLGRLAVSPTQDPAHER
ncbi:MAG TPA: HAD-IA family hydrolase [Egibacteraceae bacterium]|nr:HAD-IA family hydrolase [Egibacteraceae bacterium]